MVRCGVLAVWLLHAALAVKVKVVMRSDEDSRPEEEAPAAWERRRRPAPPAPASALPFLRRRADERPDEEDERSTPPPAAPTAPAPRPMHPNDVIFPLIYRQNHINSMFKFGENWYTWSTEKRTDGSKATNYYICYDEPKRCDDVGWERTDAVPKCAFQIDSVMPDDRACLNSFGVEPRAAGLCDGAEQMKVSEVVRACGPRIRSLWRFVRVGRRPPGAAKPADVNSLVCEDEEECFLTIEYRIHHDRITFSLHEPARGQTFKSVLRREAAEEESAASEAPAAPAQAAHHRRGKKPRDEPRSKFHARVKAKPAEGKGVAKERNESAYGARRSHSNKIKVREDISDDISE